MELTKSFSQSLSFMAFTVPFFVCVWLEDHDLAISFPKRSMISFPKSQGFMYPGPCMAHLHIGELHEMNEPILEFCTLLCKYHILNSGIYRCPTLDYCGPYVVF